MARATKARHLGKCSRSAHDPRSEPRHTHPPRKAALKSLPCTHNALSRTASTQGTGWWLCTRQPRNTATAQAAASHSQQQAGTSQRPLSPQPPGQAPSQGDSAAAPPKRSQWAACQPPRCRHPAPTPPQAARRRGLRTPNGDRAERWSPPGRSAPPPEETAGPQSSGSQTRGPKTQSPSPTAAPRPRARTTGTYPPCQLPPGMPTLQSSSGRGGRQQ